MRLSRFLLPLTLASCMPGGPPSDTPSPYGKLPEQADTTPPPSPGEPYRADETRFGWPLLTPQASRTEKLLIAVDAVSSDVVWAAGAGGTFAVTRDGGKTWRSGTVPGADSLQFRDVHGESDRVAWLLSIGNGTDSRIYRTVDGGRNWAVQFINRDPKAFFDCFAFWDERSGIAFSDNVDGIFPLLRTDDSGYEWQLVSDPADSARSPLPRATPGEGGFASSGTCVITTGKSDAWIATGAGAAARLLHTTDRGRSWTSIATPMVAGTPTTGHTSISFRDEEHGLAVGGDVAALDSRTDNVIRSVDGGKRWTPGGALTFPGPAHVVAYVPGGEGVAVAAGPRGASWSGDDGRSWFQLDTLNYWGASFVSRKAGWLVGPKGRITKVELDRR